MKQERKTWFTLVFLEDPTHDYLAIADLHVNGRAISPTLLGVLILNDGGASTTIIRRLSCVRR